MGGGTLLSARVLPLLGEGPYGVSAADLMVADSPQGDAGVFARIFYPIEKSLMREAAEEDHPVWIPRREYIAGLAHYQKRSPTRLQFLYDWIVGERRMAALWERPLAGGSEFEAGNSRPSSFPLVVFSHGLAGCRHFYSSFCSSLATHGYVVAAVEHRDYSACWTLRLATDDFSGKVREKPLLHRQMTPFDREYKVRNQQRVTECVKMLHVLEELNLGQLGENDLKGSQISLGGHFDWRQFKGRLDMSRVAVAGHSLGGATAVAACTVTTDFQAALVLDGWLFPLDPEMYTRCSQPLFFLNAGKWQFEANLERFAKFEATPGERLHYTIVDGVHMMFSDFTHLLPSFIARRLGFQGGTSSKRTGDALIELSVEFLRNALDGVSARDSVETGIRKAFSDFIIRGPVDKPAPQPTRS